MRKAKKKLTQSQVKQRKASPESPIESLNLSPCAAKYALAIADPWNSKATGACVPSNPPRDSQKLTTFTRGIMTVGQGGYGFVSVAPCLANNLYSIVMSNANYTGTSISHSLAPTGQTSFLRFAGLPYTNSNLIDEDAPNGFRTLVQGRIVSCSLSVKYIGTELNRGGRVMCYCSPDHQSVNGYDQTTIGNFAETDFSTPGYDREYCWVNSYGISSEEFEYCEAFPDDSASTTAIKRTFPLSLGTSATNAAVDVNQGAPIMAALVSGEPGNTFEIQVIQHVEYVGVLADRKSVV